MSKRKTRKFTGEKAKRERVPMLVGIVSPSGGGKTYSALRLATGMQRVTGGEIFFVDTEHRRALHYADEFKFTHVQMNPPFSPLDYLDVIEYCQGQKASILILDSMSHEHEGQGGVLEMHDAELDRLAGDDEKRRQKMTFTAWAKPKAQRRKLINSILQMGVNAIFCFRAKEKLKIIAGKNPIVLGWQPIAGEEFIFEMLVNILLYPAAKGVPNWSPDARAEDAMTKMPGNLAHIFKEGAALSEDVGEAIAQWAQGDVEPNPLLEEWKQKLLGAKNRSILDKRTKKIGSVEWTEQEKNELRQAVRTRRAALKAESPDASPPPEDKPGTGDPPPPDVDPDTGEEIPSQAEMDAAREAAQ